jgi:SET domain-containing protein
MTEPLDLPRHPAIRVVAIPGKGNGVVALEPILKGALIEAAPVVPITAADRLANTHPLYPYTFAWDEPPFDEAIALGVISLLNHSETANATLTRDYPNRVLTVTAQQDIEAGAEITIHYGIPLWFEGV